MRFVTGSGIFSRNAVTRLSASTGTQPNARASSTSVRYSVTAACVLCVQGKLRADVVARKHVAVEHEHRRIGVPAKARTDVADPAAGAHRLGLCHVLQIKSEGRTVTEMLFERLRAIRRR